MCMRVLWEGDVGNVKGNVWGGKGIFHCGF